MVETEEMIKLEKRMPEIKKFNVKMIDISKIEEYCAIQSV